MAIKSYRLRNMKRNVYEEQSFRSGMTLYYSAQTLMTALASLCAQFSANCKSRNRLNGWTALVIIRFEWKRWICPLGQQRRQQRSILHINRYKPHSNNDLHNLFGRVGCFPCRLRAPTFPSAVGRHLVHNIRGVVNTTN